ncbi:MAG: hydrolase [Myxococcota bacterium]
MKTPVRSLLVPQESVLLLIDHQPQMLFGVQSMDRQLIVNNVIGLAKAARAFKVPTVLTTVAARTFSGPIFQELRDVFPDADIVDRTTMNTWEDKRCVTAVQKTGRKKLVIAALWTEVCLCFPALDALRDGYDVHAVEDASGGVSEAAHRMAMLRMVQAGVVPVTWQQVMYEWQRDWARTDTADEVRAIAREHTGAFGYGIRYARDMWGGEEGKPRPAAPMRH